MPALCLIQTLESGVDWLLPFVPPGVVVCSSRGAHDAAVAEWVMGAILAMQRRFLEHRDAQRRSEWRDVVSARGRLPPFAGDLEGASVLVVGYGSIGKAVEDRLRPFGVDVQRVTRQARVGVSDSTALPRLVSTADIVILLLPLTPDTAGPLRFRTDRRDEAGRPAGQCRPRPGRRPQGTSGRVGGWPAACRT